MASESEAIKALDEFSDELSVLENVVGLGVVVADETQQTISSDMAVAVYVIKKLPKAALAKDQLIPPILELEINQKKVKIKTKVIEQGKVVLEEMPSKEKL